MAKSLNEVYLMGNLTRDPELKQTESGKELANFSLAVNRYYKGDQGEFRETVDYIPCVAWGKLASQLAEYCKKGSKVLVTGRLQSESWEQDGAKRSKMSVLAKEVSFIYTESKNIEVLSSNEADN